MSLFNELVEKALGGDTSKSAAQTENLVAGLLEMLGQNKAAALVELVTKARQTGLGEAINSWIGTDKNKPVNEYQIANMLGKENVAALAEKAGIPPEQGAGVLASVFPALLDKLTPDGLLPDSDKLKTIGKVVLGGVGVAIAAKAAAAAFDKSRDTIAESTASEIPDESVSGSAVATVAETSAASSQTYTVVSGDSLSKIAKRFYGNANDWQKIFEANSNLLDDPDKILPGQVLQIP